MNRYSLLAVLVVGLTLIMTAKVTVSQGVRNAVSEVAVVQAIAPAYPAIARASRTEGEVVVEVKIDLDGKVSNAATISGHEYLRKASESAASRWTFAVATQGPKERVARLVFVYTTLREIRRDDPEYVVCFKPPYRVEVQFNPPIVN
jgi:TonB family protein